MAHAPVNTETLEATPASIKLQAGMERALAKAAQCPAGSIAPARTSNSKPSRARSKQPAEESTSEATELGELLMQNSQQVHVSFLGTTLEFEASVQVDANAVSLLITRSAVTWTPPQEQLLELRCESGEFKCTYIGTRVTFGLRAVLIGFIILHDD